MDFSESLSLVGGLRDAVLVQYCQDVSAVLPDVLSLGDDCVVEMAGSTEEIVGQPVLIVVLHLGIQQVGDELGEGGGLVIPYNTSSYGYSQTQSAHYLGSRALVLLSARY